MEARGGDLTFASQVVNLRSTDLVALGNLAVSGPVNVSNEFKTFSGAQTTVSSSVSAHQVQVGSLATIQISNTGQLLALLNASGSGQVLLASSGDNSAVVVNGSVKADKGEVDIRQTGANGVVTVNNATIRGDIVKVSALGINGVLNIGNGNTLAADTILKLYATGSNGTLNFVSSVTLTSPSNILAANQINIAQGAVVTINSAKAADIFTNKANYFGFGGTGSPGAAGTFGGAGARPPLPLSNAPPLGGPGGGP